jgi:EAL domain-containing protein (putative c-di-GMP-specific phosphodiesterase class I)
MADGGQSHAIVESTIHLAQSLGLSVVAEGIEDRRTADALRKLDCEFAQGFFFAPPESAEEIGRRLARDGLLLVRSEPS